MKKLLVAAIISLSSFSTAALAEIKVGIILGFTGPIRISNSSNERWCKIGISRSIKFWKFT